MQWSEILKENTPTIIVLLMLCFALFQARRLSSDLISNIKDIPFADGWKRLAAIQRALINFYLLLVLIVVAAIRYLDLIDDQLFVAILIAILTSFGIKLGVDYKKKE